MIHYNTFNAAHEHAAADALVAAEASCPGCFDYIDISWRDPQGTNAVKLVLECGWAPRWHYQLSTGSNAAHHAAGTCPDFSMGDFLEAKALLEVNAGANPWNWPYLRPQPPLEHGSRFVLVPLQVPTDHNMDTLPNELRTPQGMVDYLSDKDPCYALGFKRHPATQADDDIILRRDRDFVIDAAKTTDSILAADRCIAVIAGNSNTANDSMRHNKPAVVLGAGIWGRGLNSPFMRAVPKRLSGFVINPWKRWAYLAWLARVQLTAQDLRDPHTVLAIAEEAAK